MESPGLSLEHKSVGNISCQQASAEAENAKKNLTGPERRERVRVASQLPLSVKYGGVYETAAEAVNISARGMFFVLRQRLEIGATVELVFRLPRRVIGIDGIWLRCSAQVVRVESGLPENKFGIGAKITSYEVFVG
jgi:hypothetical protein